ncbi:MAG: biotin carboxylase N-terminal domain-containing protein [Myxococcota bacterium]
MQRKTVHRVMLACRGVEARRIQRSASDLGMETAGLTGETDDSAVWSADIDYTMFLSNPEPTAPDVVGLALDSGCELLHPGWSRLVRDSELAGRAPMAGLQLVGPTYQHLELAADTSRLRKVAGELKIPVVPGSDPIEDFAVAKGWLTQAGYPAVGRVTGDDPDARWHELTEEEQALPIVAALLEKGPVVLERKVVAAREIEVLVMGDGEGESLTLGERDTSAQPGGERILVESPAIELDDQHAREFRTHAANLVAALRWAGLVSVRFLLTPDKRGYLLRIRPGLQAWHAVTEAVLGVDLVDAQLRMALGETLGWQPRHFDENGHAFCLRIFSTNTTNGTLTKLKLPENMRLLRGFEEGDLIRPNEELFQIIAHAPTRQAAIVRARAALEQTVIEGVPSNIDLFRAVFDLKPFWNGPLDRDRFEQLMGGSAQ